MLRIYAVMLDVIRHAQPLVTAIEARDRDLARQLRRAANSVALNLAEGSGSRGGTRMERYRNALGSARETAACFDVAEANGYVTVVDGRVRAGLREVTGTLVKIVR